MKKLSKILILSLILITLAPIGSSAQSLLSKGQINNSGTIKIKGQATLNQDSLGGKVIYNNTDNKTNQYVPQVVYDSLEFEGLSRKMLNDTTKPLVITKKFKTDTLTEVRISNNKTFIRSNGETDHNSTINHELFFGKVQLQGDTAQSIHGKGKFKELELDNSKGADVTNSGGFAVQTALRLTKGTLRNSADSNFTMADSTIIIRNVGAAISSAPIFEGKVSVRYEGQGTLTTGPEIPVDSSKLINLAVANSDSLLMDRPVTVNNQLIVGAHILTGVDTLSLISKNNPEFPGNSDVQIHGSIRRKGWDIGDTIVFNNPYTKAHFKSATAAAGVADIVMTVNPNQAPAFPQGDEKVRRQFEMKAYDNAGNQIQTGLSMYFGFGWRLKPGESYDETLALLGSFPDLILQRWLSTEWFDMGSELPQADTSKGWAFSSVNELASTGFFAVGMPSLSVILFRAKVLLEGPYLSASFGVMRSDLWERSLIPKMPDASAYPHFLDLTTDFSRMKSMPDSVVDWIVLEFNKDKVNDRKFFKTAFLRYDGRIIDIDGSEGVRLSRKDGIDSGGGLYNIVVRHRNHSPLKTETAIAIIPENNDKTIDFTDPVTVYGGTASLKLVDIDKTRRIFAMRGGFAADVQSDIDELVNVTKIFTNLRDHFSVYENSAQTGYLKWDYNLDGIVTTRDFNVSWNNRSK